MARWTLHTPCRLMLPKKILINCVDGSKIIHVLHEDLYSTIRSNVSRTGPIWASQTKDGHTYRRLDDLPNLAPASLNNTLQILERLACLRFHTALDECAGLGIEAEASGDEHKGWAHDGLTIWSNRLGCICSTILSHQHKSSNTKRNLLSVETFLSEGCVVMLDMLRVPSKRYLWLVNASSVEQVWHTRPTPSRIISIFDLSLRARQVFIVNNDKHYSTVSDDCVSGQLLGEATNTGGIQYYKKTSIK